MTTQPKKHSLSMTREVGWFYLAFFLQINLSVVIALHFIFSDAYIATTLFGLLLVLLGILGITAGSHRLWAHQSYKATPVLRAFLMLCQTLAGHGSIYDWVRRHRLHHKYFGTDLDPYNPKKGFIYSHFLATNLHHSEVQEKHLEEIDMSDLESDSIVMFQKKYYWILFGVVTLLLPINAPAEYWGENLINATFIAGWFRLGVIHHLNLLIYSASIIWDVETEQRAAYDSNWVFFIEKSYWLSYHQLAPWDYQTSEYGKYGTDCTSKFIRVCAALELASDLRTVDSQTVRDALSMSIEENKSLSECLIALQDNGNVPKEHYLTPAKYY